MKLIPVLSGDLFIRKVSQNQGKQKTVRDIGSLTVVEISRLSCCLNGVQRCEGNYNLIGCLQYSRVRCLGH